MGGILRKNGKVALRNGRIQRIQTSADACACCGGDCPPDANGCYGSYKADLNLDAFACIGNDLGNGYGNLLTLTVDGIYEEISRISSSFLNPPDNGLACLYDRTFSGAFGTTDNYTLDRLRIEVQFREYIAPAAGFGIGAGIVSFRVSVLNDAYGVNNSIFEAGIVPANFPDYVFCDDLRPTGGVATCVGGAKIAFDEPLLTGGFIRVIPCSFALDTWRLVQCDTGVGDYLFIDVDLATTAGAGVGDAIEADDGHNYKIAVDASLSTCFDVPPDGPDPADYAVSVTTVFGGGCPGALDPCVDCAINGYVFTVTGMGCPAFAGTTVGTTYTGPGGIPFNPLCRWAGSATVGSDNVSFVIAFNPTGAPVNFSPHGCVIAVPAGGWAIFLRHINGANTTAWAQVSTGFDCLGGGVLGADTFGATCSGSNCTGTPTVSR